MVFGYVFEPGDVAVIVTLILLEGVLSFDNAAVLAAMVRRLPTEQRRKALLAGLVGAYFFRVLAIVGVAFIIGNPWLKALGGGYLLWLMAHHLRQLARGDAAEHEPRTFGLRGFWGVVVAVELTDIAFALDQVLVAVAMTPKIPLIIGASLVAILMLRISAGYMVRLMEWFPRLETLAYLAVGFVGAKLLVTEALHMAGYVHFEIPHWISVTVTLSLLVAPVVIKVVVDRVRGARAART